MRLLNADNSQPKQLVTTIEKVILSIEKPKILDTTLEKLCLNLIKKTLAKAFENLPAAALLTLQNIQDLDTLIEHYCDFTKRINLSDILQEDLQYFIQKQNKIDIIFPKQVDSNKKANEIFSTKEKIDCNNFEKHHEKSKEVFRKI